MPGNRSLFFYLIAGTIVRIAYGALREPWSGQCDQLAWGMVLEHVRPSEGISYRQLIHYPHEGGSIVLSLLALITGPIGKPPALTVAALVFDLASRSVQLLVVRRYFPPHVLHWFGAWTVLSIPGVLPWSVVNFGLHSLSAFIPFAVLWLALREHSGKHGHVIDGLLLACMAWFSYSTIAVAPLYPLFRRDLFRARRHWILFSLTVMTVLGLHALVRSLADPGFHLAGFSSSTIRGMAFSSPIGLFTRNIGDVWTASFPGSSMMPSIAGFPAVTVRRVWTVFILAGLLASIAAWFRERKVERHELFGPLALLLFGAMYAASPFFHGDAGSTAFIHYRHWAFILPMATLVGIAGYGSLRYGILPLFAHAALCAAGTLPLFTSTDRAENGYKETGYVLAVKFGHDPQALSAIARRYPEAEAELFRGAGWGSAEVLLASHGAGQGGLDTLAAITRRYAARERPWFREGLALALSRDVMRGLPADMREQVRALIPTPGNER